MNVERLLAATEPYLTPIAAVDDAALQSNIRRMQATANAAGANLRPHAKTHKSARVARRQIDEGAVGLTVATLHEAGYFAENGVDDILIVHPPVGAPKRRRVTELAARLRRFAVAVDDVETAAPLPATIDILWEVDTGGRRVGTQPGAPTVEAVRALVSRIGPERFRGLLTHAGHIYKSPDPDERRRIAEHETRALQETAETLHAEGIEVREISVGATATAVIADQIGGMTEIRPGTYVYNDANQIQLGAATLDDCALGVVATVVSHPEANRIVIDAGAKALSADPPAAGVRGFGILPGHPDWTLERFNEEHGVIVSESPIDARVGDRLLVIPSHACTTVNLHGDLLVVAPDGGAAWDQAGARGWQ